MSADNWAVCPKCYAKQRIACEGRLAAPAKAYGKVSQQEYLELLEKSKLPLPDEQSLREDYEIGCTETGEFYIIYSCSCECGFSFKYKHTKQIWTKD